MPLGAASARPRRQTKRHIRRRRRGLFRAGLPRARTGDVTLRGAAPSAGLSNSRALVVAIGARSLLPSGDGRRRVERHLRRPAGRAGTGAMETSAPFHFAGDDGVGARGGAQDHVAIVCATGHVRQFAYVPARSSGTCPGRWVRHRHRRERVRATKTGNARARYSRARLRAGARELNAATAHTDVTLADALSSEPTPASDSAAHGAGRGGFDSTAPPFASSRGVQVIVPGSATRCAMATSRRSDRSSTAR